MLRLLAAVSVLALAGCANVVGSATARLADDLSAGVLNQDDLQTVREGGPAYLLMLDGLIAGDPDNVALLRAGARLYTAYASSFVDDGARAGRLAARGRDYGLRAVCASDLELCAVAYGDFEAFEAALAALDADDVPVLYDFAASWAGWVQINRDDWMAIADLPRIAAAMERVIVLDETHDRGGAHLYLAVLSTLLPSALGGHPEAGRAHFERADALAQGRNLMVKVLYARHYARLVFDRALHDRLLREVLAAEPQHPGLTLVNTLAQQQARELLASADEYF